MIIRTHFLSHLIQVLFKHQVHRKSLSRLNFHQERQIMILGWNLMNQCQIQWSSAIRKTSTLLSKSVHVKNLEKSSIIQFTIYHSKRMTNSVHQKLISTSWKIVKQKTHSLSYQSVTQQITILRLKLIR